MPRYFFHISSDADFVEDLEGIELPGEGEALEEAKEAAREILAERVRKGELIDGHEFLIHDGSGAQLFSMPFRDVLRFH